MNPHAPDGPARGGRTRRRFLQAAAGAAAAGSMTAADTAGETAQAVPATASRRVPFHGAHQSGILTRPCRTTAFVAFDTTAANRAELAQVLRALTDRARFLTTGGTPPSAGITAPPTDSGTLGETVPADGLTVTVAVGASLFDGRYGLGDRAPAG